MAEDIQETLARSDVLYQLNWLIQCNGLSIYLNGSRVEEWLPHVEPSCSHMSWARMKDGRTIEIDLESDQLVLLVKGVNVAAP